MTKDEIIEKIVNLLKEAKEEEVRNICALIVEFIG